MKSFPFLLTSILLIFSMNRCKKAPSDLDQALTQINTAFFIQPVKILSSDEFQGRRPFTPGEAKTLDYLKNAFEKLGLTPPVNGSYFQEVPLVEVTVHPEKQLSLKSKSGSFTLKYGDEFVAFSHRLQEQIEVKNSDMVFAGYGIVAPEYHWNDYKGLDVKGKTVLVLVNDPGFATGDSTFFKGRAMTYYGRWTYKYEGASRQGAEGVLIIHQSEPAGYPWNVVLNGAVIPKLYLVPEDKYASRCKLEGWVTLDAAKKIFQNADIDFSVTKNASQPGFKPVDLATQVSLGMQSSWQYKTTKNIMGVLKGSKRPDEVIIYSAHWDHLGIGRPVNGDSIYNGAVDNGTSLAWMLEIAKAFVSLKIPPERSVMFFAPAAEESGLLGSGYYVKHPIFPLAKTVADINNDLVLPYGKMRDVMITGYGQSELDDYVVKAAKAQDRYVLPDPNPHTGMYFRADHFSFAKAGVPSLFARGNCDSWEHGKEWMHQKEQLWIQNNYHKPADEYNENWDLSGVAEDAKLLFRVGYRLSNETTFPKWKEGSEFKDLRH